MPSMSNRRTSRIYPTPLPLGLDMREERQLLDHPRWVLRRGLLCFPLERFVFGFLFQSQRLDLIGVTAVLGNDLILRAQQHIMEVPFGGGSGIAGEGERVLRGQLRILRGLHVGERAFQLLQGVCLVGGGIIAEGAQGGQRVQVGLQ